MSNEIAKIEAKPLTTSLRELPTRKATHAEYGPGALSVFVGGMVWLFRSTMEGALINWWADNVPLGWVLAIGASCTAVAMWLRNRELADNFDNLKQIAGLNCETLREAADSENSRLAAEANTAIAAMESATKESLDWWTADRSIRLILLQPASAYSVGTGGSVSFPVAVLNMSPKVWTVENVQIGHATVGGTTVEGTEVAPTIVAPTMSPVRLTPPIKGDDNGVGVAFSVSVTIPKGQLVKPYTSITLSAISFDVYDEARKLTPVPASNQIFHILVKVP